MLDRGIYDFSMLSINELKNYITELRGRIRSPHDIVVGSLYMIGGITGVSAVVSPFIDNPEMVITLWLGGLMLERGYSLGLFFQEGDEGLKLACAREEYYKISEFLDYSSLFLE